jgi:hypothetical protein
MRQKELSDLGGERVQWWGARRRTAVSVPFSVYSTPWRGRENIEPLLLRSLYAAITPEMIL